MSRRPRYSRVSGLPGTKIPVQAAVTIVNQSALFVGPLASALSSLPLPLRHSLVCTSAQKV